MTIRAKDTLPAAAIAFLAANLLHGADHLRQGTDLLALPVRAGGALVTLSAVAVLSWVVVLLEIGAVLVVGCVGLARTRVATRA